MYPSRGVFILRGYNPRGRPTTAIMPAMPVPARLALPSVVSLLAASLLGVACGGVHGETGIPEGQDKPWAEMDHGERMAHMSTVVLPRMQPVFIGHDAERFADFSCATCHGTGAANGDFEIPNPNLPHLDAAGLYKKHRKESPDITKLMWKEVEPTFAEALAQTYGLGYDAQVKCSTCHIVENE